LIKKLFSLIKFSNDKQAQKNLKNNLQKKITFHKRTWPKFLERKIAGAGIKTCNLRHCRALQPSELS
jgi:hypothetical protein